LEKSAPFRNIERCPQRDGRTRPCGGDQRNNRLLAALGGSLCDTAHRLSPSSRVRASARSARCQPASPSKVDHIDEAAFCAANDPEKFHGTFEQEAAARAVNGRVSAANTRGVSGRAGLYGGWRS